MIAGQLFILPRKDICKEKNYYLLPTHFIKGKILCPPLSTLQHSLKRSYGHSQNKGKSFSLKKLGLQKTLGLQKNVLVFSHFTVEHCKLDLLQVSVSGNPACCFNALDLLNFSYEIQHLHGLARLVGMMKFHQLFLRPYYVLSP